MGNNKYMKNNGLKNRFPAWVRELFTECYKCSVCGYNLWNALHHINNPSCSWFVAGEHNKSPYNACPIHNMLHPCPEYETRQGKRGFGLTEHCHIGNETWLNDRENAKMLMRKTFTFLEEIGYQPNENDKEFIKNYKWAYE